MLARKYNLKTKTYDDVEIPDESILVVEDMDTIVKCAECRKNMKYGDGFTSFTIHAENGLGYSVCESCYAKEAEQERQYAK